MNYLQVFVRMVWMVDICVFVGAFSMEAEKEFSLKKVLTIISSVVLSGIAINTDLRYFEGEIAIRIISVFLWLLIAIFLRYGREPLMNALRSKLEGLQDFPLRKPWDIIARGGVMLILFLVSLSPAILIAMFFLMSIL